MVGKPPPNSPQVELDLSDVDHRVGKPIGGGQLWDPCSSTDIRRWVMAMDYPNPLHWDHEFARDPSSAASSRRSRSRWPSTTATAQRPRASATFRAAT